MATTTTIQSLSTETRDMLTALGELFGLTSSDFVDGVQEHGELDADGLDTVIREAFALEFDDVTPEEALAAFGYR